QRRQIFHSAVGRTVAGMQTGPRLRVSWPVLGSPSKERRAGPGTGDTGDNRRVVNLRWRSSAPRSARVSVSCGRAVAKMVLAKRRTRIFGGGKAGRAVAGDAAAKD